MDPVKNSAGNPLNSADWDLLCLETERTHLGGSNAPTHVSVRFFNFFEKKINFEKTNFTTKGGFIKQEIVPKKQGGIQT